MTKYLAGVLSVIAAGVLLIAYGLLAPNAQAAFDSRGFVNAATPDGAFYAYPSATAYPGQAVPVSYAPAPMLAAGSTRASSATTAAGCTPAGSRRSGCSSCAMRA